MRLYFGGESDFELMDDQCPGLLVVSTDREGWVSRLSRRLPAYREPKPKKAPSSDPAMRRLEEAFARYVRREFLLTPDGVPDADPQGLVDVEWTFEVFYGTGDTYIDGRFDERTARTAVLRLGLDEDHGEWGLDLESGTGFEMVLRVPDDVGEGLWTRYSVLKVPRSVVRQGRHFRIHEGGRGR